MNKVEKIDRALNEVKKEIKKIEEYTEFNYETGEYFAFESQAIPAEEIIQISENIIVADAGSIFEYEEDIDDLFDTIEKIHDENSGIYGDLNTDSLYNTLIKLKRAMK